MVSNFSKTIGFEKTEFSLKITQYFETKLFYKFLQKINERDFQRKSELKMAL